MAIKIKFVDDARRDRLMLLPKVENQRIRRGGEDVCKGVRFAAFELRRDGIHALTGLSRFVGREEGEKLIARAMAAGPANHRCLLARARLREDDLESQIADAKEAIRLSSNYAETHIFLARALLKHKEADHAFNHLKIALEQLPYQREFTPMFVDAAMSIAAAGYGDQMSKLLQDDEFGATMEPVIVALRIKRGDVPIVAKEVMEVAKDIAAGSTAPKRTSG